MDINRFTEKLQESIRAAQTMAVRYGHQQLDVEHLLRSLLEQKGGLASPSSRAPASTPTLSPRVWNRNWTGCPKSPAPRLRHRAGRAPIRSEPRGRAEIRPAGGARTN